MQSLTEALTRTLLVLVSRFWGVLALLLAWELWVLLRGLNPIVMPSPSRVLGEIASHPSLFFTTSLQTLVLAALGLLLGTVLGVGMAAAAWTSRIITGLLTPITLIFSSVPVIALIPVIARMLGYDLRTVLAIVVIICFFPSFVFASAGLRALPPGSNDLFRALGAGRMTTLRWLALPSAVPNLMIAIRLAASHAILAAMVRCLRGNGATRPSAQVQEGSGASWAGGDCFRVQLEQWAPQRPPEPAGRCRADPPIARHHMDQYSDRT